MVRIILAGACLLAAVPSAATAQEAVYHRGLWLGAGAGPGFGKGNCSICNGAQEAGVAGQVRVGGTISPQLRASVEATGWRQDGATTDRRLVLVGAFATWYPSRDLGLHGKAGVGAYAYREENSVDRLTSQGMALQLALGYDVALSRSVALTPFAALIRSGFGNPSREDIASGFKQPLFSDLTVRFVQVGLGITLQ